MISERTRSSGSCAVPEPSAAGTAVPRAAISGLYRASEGRRTCRLHTFRALVVGVSSHPRAGCALRPHLASTVAIRVLRGRSEIRRTLVATDLERFVSAKGRDDLVKEV